jgi:hypothetical protein
MSTDGVGVVVDVGVVVVGEVTRLFVAVDCEGATYPVVV